MKQNNSSNDHSLTATTTTTVNATTSTIITVIVTTVSTGGAFISILNALHCRIPSPVVESQFYLFCGDVSSPSEMFYLDYLFFPKDFPLPYQGSRSYGVITMWDIGEITKVIHYGIKKYLIKF